MSNKYNLKIKHWEFFLVILIFSIFSALIIKNYVGGDRIVYEDIYYNISEFSLLEALDYYYIHISSPDIIWLISAYLFSILTIDFNIFSFFISFFVFVGFLNLGTKYIKSNLIFYLFLTSLFLNIQFLTLYFSSQRLGIAIIFLTLTLTTKSYLKRTLFIVSSILSHLTIIFFFIIIFLKSIIIKNYNGGVFLLTIPISIFILSIISIFGDLIFDKIFHYYTYNQLDLIFNYLKYSPIPFIVFYINRSRLDLVINCIIFFILLIFNDERVFQLGYLYAIWSIFTCYSMRAVLIGLAFNVIPCIRGIEYIMGVFSRGNGLDPENFLLLRL